MIKNIEKTTSKALICFEKGRPLKKDLRISGDKSISHRILMMAAQKRQHQKVFGLGTGADIQKTYVILKQSGFDIHFDIHNDQTRGVCHIYGGYQKTNHLPDQRQLFDCGNAGTTARLMIGLFFGQDKNIEYVGDESLMKRPMQPLIGHLKHLFKLYVTHYYQAQNELDMDVVFDKVLYAKGDGGVMPVMYNGHYLHAFLQTLSSAVQQPKRGEIVYELNSPSAQIKSAIIFAARNLGMNLRIIEKTPSRDHTENMLAHFFPSAIECYRLPGQERIIDIHTDELFKCHASIYEEKNVSYQVPSDPSSLAFLVVLVLLARNHGHQNDIKQKKTFDTILLNKHRTAYLDVLKEYGANITVSLGGHGSKEGEIMSPMGEDVGSVTAETSVIDYVHTKACDAPSLIDEFPILSVVACCGSQKSIFENVNELQFKESDRLMKICDLCSLFGAKTDIKKHPDGRLDLHIVPNAVIARSVGGSGNGIGDIMSFDPGHDHRMAMSAIIAAIITKSPLELENVETINSSFPNFFECLAILGYTRVDLNNKKQMSDV